MDNGVEIVFGKCRYRVDFSRLVHRRALLVFMWRRWRLGLGIEPRIAGWAPLIGVLVGGVGVAINAVRDDGDLRVGFLPWGVAFMMACLAACCLGLLAIHGPAPTRVLLVGAWWTTLAVLGVAGFFLAVAVGTLIGIEEEDAGIAILPPLLGMMFGAISMAPAIATLATGMSRARLMPRWSPSAAWVAAPVVPLLLLLGITDGAVETIGSGALIAIFGASWIAIGISLTQHQSRHDHQAVPERRG